MMNAGLEAIWDAVKIGDMRPPYYPAEAPVCPAGNERTGYVCTRHRDHENQHVATVPEEVVDVWSAAA